MTKRQFLGILVIALLLVTGVVARLLIGRDPAVGGVHFNWPDENIFLLR